MNRTNLYICDRTFYTAPIGYTQVYIIQSQYFSKMIPTCFILMKWKNEKSYNKAFNIIKTIIKNEPKHIIIDFKTAANNALRKVFKSSEMFGCNFLFTQIIIRFLNKNQYLEKYKNDENYKKFVKFLLILSYVPENHVKEEFKK